MRLAHPLPFAGRNIAHFMVRTNDCADAAQTGRTVPQFDPNEIVVTARKQGKDSNRCSLNLGREDLVNSSSITF
jgi:hypothetical protein